jgi:polysaccharide export outer membrane protein
MKRPLPRGEAFYTLPLDLIVSDPRQILPLKQGDVVTALFQSLSFTAPGAAGKNKEISCEAQGITLVQALALDGGLQESLSDVKGLFIFQLESENALDLRRASVCTEPERLVPVVYRLGIGNPESFLVTQSFPIKNKDVLYDSNAPAT